MIDLERRDDCEPATVAFAVEERVGHGDRHLVAHLGGAHRVGEDQNVGHVLDPISPPSID
jgi:hypothetical protein